MADVTETTAELRVLRQLSSRINATLELPRIYDIVLSTMDELFGFRHSLLLLVDEPGTTLTVVASHGYREQAVGAEIAVGTGIIGVVAQRKRMMRIGNLASRRAYMDAIRREMAQAGRAEGLQQAPELPGLPDAESQIAIPLLIEDRLVGVFSVETAERTVFSERHEVYAAIVANLAASAISNAQLYQREKARRASLEDAVAERTRELERTSRELDVVRELHEKGAPRFRFADLVGRSSVMREVRELLRKVAASPSSTILITGENGTGKDLAAKILHCNSGRAAAPFMNITCSALPEPLLESELFGHERGAFTDAKKDKRGLLELADGGTVFLDEIGEMSLVLQAKLLRFLEEKTFRRVGGARDIRVDVRIVAATNRDLQAMVRDGRFREDLYYRLRVLPV
ncbi:MAG: sigma 54-interacting transcriptional regulator, partial [Acidobacteria bacterium]|nr:sigma 54-interacting transcriptional regulator [Acidobacteriota bacterium]